jgi:concanavalin A-like lectin/glucanase superfamily protein
VQDWSAIDWDDPLSDDDLNRGLVSWWLAGPDSPFWGTPTLRDIVPKGNSRGGNHGTLTNGLVWQGALGRPGGWGCLSFDGSADYVDISATVSFTPPLTLSFWARPASVTTAWYASDSPQGAASNGLACILGFQSGYWNIYRDSGGGGAYPTGTATDSQMAASGAGLWDHVCWVWNGTTLQGYTQGQPRINVTASSWTSGAIPGRQIGRPYGAASNLYQGEQDDLTFHNRALSAAEVALLYEDSRQGYPRRLRRERQQRWVSVAAEPAARGNFLTLLGVS